MAAVTGMLQTLLENLPIISISGMKVVTIRQHFIMTEVLLLRLSLTETMTAATMKQKVSVMPVYGPKLLQAKQRSMVKQQFIE